MKILSFFLIILSINSEAALYDAYFDLEGISQSCKNSFEHSLKSLPQNLRQFLSDTVKKTGVKFKFKKISSEDAANFNFKGTVYGVPTFFASHHTIYTTNNHCSKWNYTMTHEIGHIIHATIKEHHSTLAQEWSQLWSDVHQKNGSPNVGNFSCPFDNCPFIGWKDVENEDEGFAQLILLSTYDYRQGWKNNKHPDFIRKIKFLNMLRTQIQIQKTPTTPTTPIRAIQ